MRNIIYLITKTKFLLLVLGMLFIALPDILATQAQPSAKKTINGTVTDSKNEPLIGVTILVVGTSQGTLTDIDGNYSIEVRSDVKLKYSYTGYISQEVAIGNQSVVNVTLLEDSKLLDEVVVIGYGVQQKSHLTGSIAKVKTEGLEDIPVSRVDQALQGRVAGVTIRNTTSEVGVVPEVRVRAGASVSAESSPLVIVDGFPLEDGLGVVNMNDVQSIEVLKDAASAAIYGSRAANGVIIVTTKSGTESKPKYSLKMNWGVKNAYKLHPIMTSQEYVGMVVEEARLTGATSLPRQDFALWVLSQDNTTDWQNEALRTSSINNIQFNIQGGDKKTKYMVSASQTNDQGIMYNNEYQKLNLRAKIDTKLSKRVSIGINLAPTYSKTERPGVNFIDFYRTPSFMPVRHNAVTSAITGYAVGSYASGWQFNNATYTGVDPLNPVDENGNTITRTEITSPYGTSNNNPKSIMDNVYRDQKDYRLNGSGYISINLMKNLDFKSSNSFNLIYQDKNYYQTKNAKKDGETSRGLYQNRLNITLLTENTLNYKKKFNKVHDFSAMVGFSAQKITDKTAGILGYDFPTDYIQTLNAAGTISQFESDTQYTGTWMEDETLASFYGRAIYSYQDKYLASASLRTDGSSKFGANNLWAWFPSISLGWRLSEEKFMKDHADWIDQLKLRASYGITGTNKIESYANMDRLQSANYILGTGQGTVSAGMANLFNNSLGNPNLQWEQTNEYNLGLDLAVLKNRLNLTVDLYYSKTKSLLFKKDISTITGYSNVWTNLGKVRNQGIEVELTSYNIKSKNVEWNTSFNISANRNKLLDLGGVSQQITYGDQGEMYIAKVGEPVVQFYGYKTIGVWASEEEVANNPHYVIDRSGGLRVQNTNNDGEINDDDRVALGSPYPDFTWGITNNVNYRNFDLSVLLQGSQGGKVFNRDELYNETRKYNKNYVVCRWISETNTGNGKTPYYDYGIKHYLTDYPLQDASYIALRDITIGYTVSKKILKSTIFSSLRLYTSIQNLGYWWPGGYKGINPEARQTTGTYSNALINGYQTGGFPIQRVFNFGIDVNF
ncbi:MAG: SusC/RagA family TonB-linked outer membrane protein [Dysgonomonas sp.]